MPQKPLASSWVVNSFAMGLLVVFMSAVATMLYLGYQQIMANAEYSAESFGAINNLIVYLMGVMSGIVGSVIFGMKTDDIKAMTKDASDRSKDNMALMEDEQPESLREKYKDSNDII